LNGGAAIRGAAVVFQFDPFPGAMDFGGKDHISSAAAGVELSTFLA